MSYPNANSIEEAIAAPSTEYIPQITRSMVELEGMVIHLSQLVVHLGERLSSVLVPSHAEPKTLGEIVEAEPRSAHSLSIEKVTCQVQAMTESVCDLLLRVEL